MNQRSNPNLQLLQKYPQLLKNRVNKLPLRAIQVEMKDGVIRGVKEHQVIKGMTLVSTQYIILMDIHVEDAEVEVDTEEEMVTIVEGVHLVRGEIGAAEEDLEDLLVVEEGDMDNRTRDMVDLLEGDLVVDHEEAPEVIVVDAVGEDPHSKSFFVRWNTFETNLH